MATTVTGSSYISILDSKILTSLCSGNFYVDVTPSTYAPGGESYVYGASVQIVNPLGITIKAYSTSGWDIEPPMTTIVEYPIPLSAGNFVYGTYTITVKLTDENDVDWEIVKSVNICAPDKKNKNKKTGCLNASIKGDCVNGKTVVVVDAPPNYKGILFDSQVNDLTLLYPTVSEVAPLDTTMSAFSVQLYEGEYKLTGNVCATYDYGDNVFFEIKYDVKSSKDIKCSIDKCCVNAKLSELNARLKSDCIQAEKETTSNIIFDALRLLTSIDYAAFCGDDPSDYISELEDLLGCICTCNCNDGTPVINSSPTDDFTFSGCGFTETVTGLTTDIEIYNYDNEIVITDADNTGILTNGEDTVNGCTKSLSLVVNKAAIEAIAVVSKGYNSVVGTMTQTSTGAPVLTIWSNDTDIVFGTPTRGSAGDYIIPITGVTLTGATVMCLTGQEKTSIASMGIFSTSSFYVQTTDGVGVFADEKLVATGFEIRVKI